MSKDLLKYLPIGIVAAIFGGYILYGLFILLHSLVRDTLDDLLLHFKNSVDSSLQEKYEIHLRGRFRYYDKLPDKLKVKFLLRVKNFVRAKTFESRDEMEVTDEMKIWVAASAVQLTFGLRNYRFDHFWKIILYPESYYSRAGDAYYMGETNAHGIIVLSWKDLQRGYSISDDSFNVGLHEMAHALELQYKLQEDYDFYFAGYFEKWSKMAEETFENVSEERESFLRKYAGTNRQEFFAVCVEYFFEASEEFHSRLPQVYYHLCMLLNQDPLAADTRVARKETPNELVLSGQLQQLVPVFTTDYSYFSISFDFIVVLFAFSMLTLQGFKSTAATFYASIVIAVFLLTQLFFNLNKFILFDKYLVVKSFSGKIKRIYELEDIVSVHFQSDRAGKRMLVSRAREGEIVQSSHSYISTSHNIDEFVKKLAEQNVLVR